MLVDSESIQNVLHTCDTSLHPERLCTHWTFSLSLLDTSEASLSHSPSSPEASCFLASFLRASCRSTEVHLWKIYSIRYTGAKPNTCGGTPEGRVTITVPNTGSVAQCSRLNTYNALALYSLHGCASLYPIKTALTHRTLSICPLVVTLLKHCFYHTVHWGDRFYLAL